MKLYIKSIILASFLSICSMLFLSSNCSATLSSNNSLSVGSVTESASSGYTVANSMHTIAMSSPTLIIPPQASGITIHTSSSNNDGSVISKSGFFFYSNNPESVNDGDLADNGCWLNRAEVSGNGQVYAWHKNSTSGAINSVLYIINSSDVNTITVKTNQYALTTGVGSSDVAAWDSYLGSSQTSISVSVKPGQCVELFKQAVARENNFGLIAALDITDTEGNPAKAILEDVVYNKNVSAAKYAKLDEGINGGRGVGLSYQNTITFEPIRMSDSNDYTLYNIGAINDSLNGKDLVKIKDGSTQKESLLEGNYGEVMTIILPIKNFYKDQQNFGIFIGSTGGYSFPFVRLQENSFVASPVKPFTAYNMIQTGKMAFGSSEKVSFTLVIPALSSTPLIIGIHPIL